MFTGHYYHATIRKTVAVFGTLFNNISVMRKDGNGKVVNITRVPLAYGPKQKFLARLDEQPDLNANKVAIKLPRMSFEIISMTYDATIKTNRNNVLTFTDPADSTTKQVIRNYAPYRMGIQLSIMAKNQDDALQIIEQILPNFQPEYTVTIKDLDDLNLKTDIPFVLTGVTMQDDYEGEFTQRRAIIYTLDFETRLRFYGPTTSRSVIKDITVGMMGSSAGTDIINVNIDPTSAGPGDAYTINTSITFMTTTDKYTISVTGDGASVYTVGEYVIGSGTGSSAIVTAFTNNVLSVRAADGPFLVNETLTGQTSGCARSVVEAMPYYPPFDP